MKTLPHIRKQEILDTLRQRGSIDVQDLSKRFGVTYMTIHRDLQALEEEGLLSRVYGGAVAAAEPEASKKAESTKPASTPGGYAQATEANRLIANAAAGQVRNGDIIALDASTRALQMWPLLHEKHITVVTNGLNIALQFADSETVEVLLTGGTLRRSSMSLVNLRSPDLLEHINIDKCFFSASAISPRKGVMERDYQESEAKRELLRRADRLYVLADHSRLGGNAPYMDCPCERVHALVTDRYAQITPEMNACLRELARSGIRILYGTP